jgi:hypothetical protein
MIVQKSRYVRTHVVGGGGIFDTIANIVKRITGNTVGDLASKLLVSAGTSMASEAGKRLASRLIVAPSAPQAPQQVSKWARTLRRSPRLLRQRTDSTTANELTPPTPYRVHSADATECRQSSS